jgi:hypothetical protein
MKGEIGLVFILYCKKTKERRRGSIFLLIKRIMCLVKKLAYPQQYIIKELSKMTPGNEEIEEFLGDGTLDMSNGGK